MFSVNKLLAIPAIGTVFSLQSVDAAVIFDASPTNSGVVDNNVNQTSNTVTGTTGALTVTTVTTANNHMSGIASNDDINTLKGSPLLATDTVTMTLSISSSTLNNIRANGLEFGMSPAAPIGAPDTDTTDFRPVGNLLFQIDADNDASGMAINNLTSAGLLQDAGWVVTEGSLGNGFTVSLVADSAGYTFTLTDIQEVGNLTNTTLSYSNTFTGTQFVDNFGGGHIYYARQIATGTAEVNISEFSIDVTPVPEPSTTALLGLITLGFVFKRRRAS